MSAFSLGIDIGGTFTDVVVHQHESGRSYSTKILTTHDDPRLGAIAGVRRLLQAHDINPVRVTRVVHATTLLTNAVIERKGAKTALITTKGFRDILEIGRERRYALYDLNMEMPAPLVPRNLRFEVAERVRAGGEIEAELQEGDIVEKITEMRRQGVTSVAVVFLHSYANPANEQKAGEVLARLAPEMLVTLSHEVAPEIREYERLSTTVASAYIKPIAASYLSGLQENLGALGITAKLLLMISSGGLTHLEEVIANPVQMLESGPAAGALAASFFGGQVGREKLLAFDMGGTTAKLSMIENGEPLVAYSFEAAREKRFMEGSGLPIKISTIELIEIGAGGGSIARKDSAGLLKVGPESAGSEPGPACYGLGGQNTTVTDANLQLGYLNPKFFAGGTLKIEESAANAALDRTATELGLPAARVAAGIHDLVNEAMASAARVHIAERGRDPRSYSLVVTGGGGPVHGYGVAKKLGLREIICPPSPGVASAWGLLVAPARVDRVTTTRFSIAHGEIEDFERVFGELEAEALAVLQTMGFEAANAVLQRTADGRFRGQGFDLVTPLPPGPFVGAASRERILKSFEAAYREKFSRPPPQVPLEFVAARTSARATITGGEIAKVSRSADVEAAITGRRKAWFMEAGDYLCAAVFDRTRLGSGAKFSGPALVEDAGSTLVVGPSGRCEVTDNGSIIVAIA